MYNGAGGPYPVNGAGAGLRHPAAVTDESWQGSADWHSVQPSEATQPLLPGQAVAQGAPGRPWTTHAAPVPSWVDPALAGPAQPWLPPPSAPIQSRTAFASHPLWDSTLNGTARWSGMPDPAPLTDWSLPQPPHSPPTHTQLPHSPLAPTTSTFLASSPPSSTIAAFPQAVPPYPDPPSSLPAPYSAYPPSASSEVYGASHSSNSGWDPVPTASTSSIWPHAAPPAPVEPTTSYHALTLPTPRPHPPSAFSTLPHASTSLSARAHDTASASSASATSTGSKNDKGKGKARTRRSPRASPSTAGESRSSRSPRQRSERTLEGDDQDDFYPLAEGATKGGKPKKPRRKRRKLGEPPRDLAQRKYACELCVDQPKSFARPSALRIHMLTHTKEKPHICPLCYRSFAIISNLKRHLKLHEKQGSGVGRADAAGELGALDDDEGDGDETIGPSGLGPAELALLSASGTAYAKAMGGAG
ncbi:hypothetical protein JCM10207_000446 [Rhodosporidiobolus poonsookiae]